MQDTHRQPFPHPSSHLLFRQLTFKMLGYVGAQFVMERNALAEQPSTSKARCAKPGPLGGSTSEKTGKMNASPH